VVSLLDLYPTLVELTGLPTPQTPQDGRSLATLMRGGAAHWENVAVSHEFRSGWSSMGVSVRSGHYRYTENGDGTVELYDARVDPYEWNNLAADPALAALVQELSRQARATLPATP
jgi:arylsulfatase A-like enzyme